MAMIFFNGHFTFCLVLLSFFFIMSTSTLAGADVVVDIQNGLPSNTNEPLKLSCDRPSLELKVGDHYNLTVKEDAGLECTAMWLQFFATWDAYEANSSDKGHGSIFWSVRKDGFYRSWDQSQWKKIVDWSSD